MGLKLLFEAYFNGYKLKHDSTYKNGYIITENFMENRMARLFVMILMNYVGILSAQTYCAGDQISTTHQNQVHEVCAGFEDYETGDSFKLADYNGEINGGNYNIIFIDMSASW
jgi:hypothetical protein